MFFVPILTCSQGCGAGAQAILDHWSRNRSQNFFRWWSWSRSLKSGFRFKRVIQIIQCFFCFLDQVVLEQEPEPKISRCWSRSLKFEYWLHRPAYSMIMDHESCGKASLAGYTHGKTARRSSKDSAT